MQVLHLETQIRFWRNRDKRNTQKDFQSHSTCLKITNWNWFWQTAGEWLSISRQTYSGTRQYKEYRHNNGLCLWITKLVIEKQCLSMREISWLSSEKDSPSYLWRKKIALQQLSAYLLEIFTKIWKYLMITYWDLPRQMWFFACGPSWFDSNNHFSESEFSILCFFDLSFQLSFAIIIPDICSLWCFLTSLTLNAYSFLAIIFVHHICHFWEVLRMSQKFNVNSVNMTERNEVKIFRFLWLKEKVRSHIS
jgi:hypothetical protein